MNAGSYETAPNEKTPFLDKQLTKIRVNTRKWLVAIACLVSLTCAFLFLSGIIVLVDVANGKLSAQRRLVGLGAIGVSIVCSVLTVTGCVKILNGEESKEGISGNKNQSSDQEWGIPQPQPQTDPLFSSGGIAAPTVPNSFYSARRQDNIPASLGEFSHPMSRTDDSLKFLDGYDISW